MSTITKEFIDDTIEGLEHLANSGIQSVYIDMAIAGMRRLLASLEAEPVAMRWRYLPDGIHEIGEWNYRDQGYIDTLNAYHLSRQKELLYTAHPAPVSVPDELLSAMEEVLRISDRDHEAWHKAKAGILSCRAAMIQ
jgi:hypothetical protein